MVKELIEYFGVDDCVSNEVNFIELQKRAIKVGYIIHPKAANEDVDKFINSISFNINSTFYKTWEDVTSKTREELFIDQCTHYASVYYLGECWKPYDDVEYIPVDYKDYKVITPSSIKDVCERCESILKTGIALKNTTQKVICNYICDNNPNINVDELNNKEAISIICNKLKITPKKSFNLLRYIIYETIGETQLIKSREVISSIINKSKTTECFDWLSLTDDQLKELSKIFYRFKPLFLAYKTKNKINCVNNRVINKIRRYAKKYHQPLKTGFWESVVANITDGECILHHLQKDQPTNFKVLQLMQSIREHCLMSSGEYGNPAYIVRNGKIWVDKQPKKYNEVCEYWRYWQMLYNMLKNYVVENIRDKACVVKFPDELILTCPTSEKNYIGNIPLGSYYDANEKTNNIIGIHWDDKSSLVDLDLSFLSIDDKHIGWYGAYNTDGIVYSGDITYPNPEATELLLCKNECPSGSIHVNLYNGQIGGKYNFFFAREDIKDVHPNYMVNPSSVKFNAELEMTSRQMMLGYIIDNKIYISNLRFGDVYTSRTSIIPAKDLILVLKRKLMSYIPLKEILLVAGFKEYNPGDDVELDLNDLKKDTIINIFKRS